MTRHALVRSGQGRVHLALQGAELGVWVGLCGSRITRQQGVAPYRHEQLLEGVEVPVLEGPACYYCRAIAAAVQHEHELGLEAVADAGLYWLQRA